MELSPEANNSQVNFNRIWVRFPAALRRKEKPAIRIFRFGGRSADLRIG
jgi:hypothetical protein